MEDKNRINFDIDSNFTDNIERVPSPKFNVGESVFYVEWDGTIKIKEIDTVEWDIKFSNNGYCNIAKYQCLYAFVTGPLYCEAVENRLFNNKAEAEEFSNKVKLERKEMLDKTRKERIKELTTELAKLLNQDK